MNNSFNFFIFQMPNPNIAGENMTHNKYLSPLFFEDGVPISAKSASDKLSLNFQSVQKYLRLTIVFM